MFRFNKTSTKAVIITISLLFVVQIVCFAQTTVQREIPITCSSDEARAAFIEARDALDMGRTNDARALLDKAIKKDPKFACAYLFKAYSPNSAAEWKSNMELAVANKSAVSEGEQILIEMKMTFLNNDAEKRFVLAKKLVEKYPASQRALLVLAGEHQGRKEYAKARNLMNTAMQINPEFPLPHRDLGFSSLFDEPKDFDLAEKHMIKFVELRPDEASTHIGLGDVYRAQQKLKKARDAYAKAAEINPESDVAFSKKGHANTYLGYYEEARADFKQAQEVAKDNSKATWANYATFTYLYAGDAKSALAANQKVIDEIDDMGIPEDQLIGPKMGTHFNRAMMAMYNGKFDIAEEALKQRAMYMLQEAEEVASDDFTRGQKASIALTDGILAARRGDYRTALLKADENTKLLEPDNNPRKLEGYQRLRGLIALLQKNYNEAVEHYQKANVNNVQVKHELALAHEGLGNVEQAYKLFKEVAEFNFNWVGYAVIRNEAIEKTKIRTKIRTK